ncbi:MAG: hypothetical protein ACR650_16570 [Methylocystis sp.]
MTTLGDLVAKDMLVLGDGYRAKNEELGTTGPVFLRSAYLQDSGWVLHDPDRLSQPYICDFGVKAAQLLDTVLTTKGNSLGRLGLVREEVAGAIYSPHLSFWRSSCHDKLNPRFLYYWAHSAEAQRQIKARSESTDMAPYLSLSDQLAIEITLPNPSRQIAIANVLGALDDKIELNRRMAATLEEMARALFKSWFVDFDPVRAKAEGRDPDLPADIAALFPSRFGEDKFPEGWGATADQIGYNIREQINPADVKSDTSYVGLEHIGRRQLILAELGEASEVESQKVVFKRGDLLFGKLRPYFHKVAIAPCDGICSTDIFVFRPQAGVPSVFLYLAFASDGFVAKTSGAQEGTRMPRADWDFMRKQFMARPGPNVMAAFDKTCAPLIDRAQAAIEQNRTLAALRNTLLPKLTSGELVIKDAESAVEAA